MQLCARASAPALIQAQNVFSLVLNEKALQIRQNTKDLAASITYASIQLKKKLHAYKRADYYGPNNDIS